MPELRLTRSDLIALARKYRVLAEARRLPEPWSAELAALCREFPGVLRELDLLALDEIDRRLEALERATRTGRLEPWMVWVHAYHRSMRATQLVRRRLAGRRSLADTLARDLADEAERETGFSCDVELVMTLASSERPPVQVIVLACLERQLGTSAAMIRRALFPEVRSKDAIWTRI